MGPLALVVGALFGSFAGVKALATMVASAGIWANNRIANAALRNYRLGVNPVFEKVVFLYETQKEKMFGMGDFTKFLYQRITFEASDLPEHMAHLAHEWCLNREEYERLCIMIRQDQINAHVGPEWEKFQAILESIHTEEGQRDFQRYNMGKPSYLYLEFVSKNRLEDKKFMLIADAVAEYAKQKTAA